MVGVRALRLRRSLLAFGAAILLCPLAAAAAQQGEQGGWAKLPRMQLERQFAGPLQDTIIQRWRDPVDGVVCYIYLPITAAHTPPTASGFVEYGANSIGSISCVEPAPHTSSHAERRSPPPEPLHQQ